eukprot:4850506-Pleurochrysis_carterae.AAC.2
MGYAPNDVLGRSVSILNGPYTCRETLAALRLAMGGGTTPMIVMTLSTLQRVHAFGADEPRLQWLRFIAATFGRSSLLSCAKPSCSLWEWLLNCIICQCLAICSVKEAQSSTQSGKLVLASEFEWFGAIC